MTKGLSVRDLTVRYGKREILHGMTLSTMQPGKVTALLGPNGSGKSSFLRAIAGLTPSTGYVGFDGRDLSSLPIGMRARVAAYLPQTLPPMVHLQVLEAVMVARRAGENVAAEQALRDSIEILEKIGIDNLALRYLDELSGGQRQLVGLAQALVRRPEMLLLDEPLSALDLRYQFAVMEVVRRETQARGIVTLLVVHDLNIALQRADDVVYMRDGRLLGQGVVMEVTTPEMLADVYGVQTRLEVCPRGLPHVLVDGVV
ncbi:ATP-binding cassette domain-containing protein [Saccharibacter sp. 17.LH.SD]|uniref:ABC transporter ATP-binding protein n=1 Tax=Saccharibacter sp. 17.LH.SD TaxID=2689393 RepID=UPI00136C86EF|nr:ABC transporter ATP-binding protein [Saccharibacter sp. 17.LH.SD]MXV44157.1 ATP-binding cassette domain-containing protein [Saccharibacter sp. 17.LH.SD]